MLEKAREGVLALDLPACIKDSQLRYVCVNEAYARFAGRASTEFTRKTTRQLLGAADDDEREEKERRCLVFATEEIAGCRSHCCEETHPLKCERFETEDGDLFLYEVFEAGFASDAHQQVQPSQDLLAARHDTGKLHTEVQSILQSLPVGVMLLGRDLTIEYANKCFYDLWEVTEQIDLVGQPYRRYFQMGYESGKYDFGESSFEEAYRDRVKRLSLVDGYASREVESKTGKFTILSKQRISGDKILITFSDSTAVRAREREINSTRQELQRVGEYMQDATRVMAQGLALIQNGKFIMSNEALSRMFDVAPEMMAAGKGWLPFFDHCAKRGDFGDADEIASTRAQWLDNIAAARPFSWIIHVDGKRWLNLESTIGAGEYWLAIVTDITDMKQREAELEGLLARAEAADRAKSEFLANMSHEIRTPMNGVLGMAELLAKSELDTRQRMFTDVIVKSGNALLTIINDILDFSKIDAGQMTLRNTSFDAAEAVEDVASLLSSQALQKNIELIVRVDPSFTQIVSGDAGRFRQIATNLIGNAIKFTETGHVLIELSSKVTDESELILTLCVRDTGIGIAQHELDRIFEKFSQADASSTRRHEGTGLGLAITVGLVGLFGGKVDVESTVGQGSAFTVTLPLRVVGERNEQSTSAADMKNVSVLVIDDNAINRQILTEQLTRWGIDSHAAESGEAGLAILEEATRIGFNIDAVILDYHMPEMDGMQVAAKIRADARLNDTALVFLTSMDAVNTGNNQRDIQFDAHLMKPVRARLLRKTLTDVVRTSRARRGIPHQPDVYATRARPTPPVTEAPTALHKPKMQAHTASLDVLIAEDNDVNQIVFTQILQQTGLHFRIVANGKKAVEAWREDNPSIILMDVSMPVMDGHQATRAIRAEEHRLETGARVPIIGVTAYAQDSDRDLCLAAGMDDYLSKPISPELLQAKIDKWLMRLPDKACDLKSK